MGRPRWVRALCLGLCVSPALAIAQTSSDGSVPADAPPDEPDVIDLDDADPRALSDFRPLLDRYGAWVDDARYGLVWVPSRQLVGDDFAPYLTRGRWALDTAGDWVW